MVIGSTRLFAFGRAVRSVFFGSHFSPSAKNETQKMVASTRPQAKKT